MTVFDDTMFLTLWIIALVVWAGMAAATSLARLDPD
jgi:hypothetical protein